MGPVDILKFMRWLNYFCNAIVAYRILLTISANIASVKNSFYKLKLLKLYLHSIMTWERLNYGTCN